MPERNDFNARTIEEFRAYDGKVGGYFEARAAHRCRDRLDGEAAPPGGRLPHPIRIVTV